MHFAKRLVLSTVLAPLVLFSWTALATVASADNSQPVYNANIDAYEISTAAQLEQFDDSFNTYLSANIILLNDIDLSGFSWIPVGPNSDFPFTGNFNGENHVIHGVTIQSDPGYSSVGLFGASRGDIENLGLVDVNVVGGSGESLGTGALVGDQTGGSISNVYSSGTVSGHSKVGGLVGLNAGTVQGSFSSVNVSGLTADASAGGLIGMNDGTVRDSYATGAVTGPTYNGGLIGQNTNSGIVSSSYSLSSVGAGNFAGALIGLSQGSVTESVYDVGVGSGLSGVGVGSTAGITGLGDVAMKDATDPAYQTWDFATTWVSESSLNHGYPALQAFLTASVSADPTTMTANQTLSVYGSVYYAASAVSGYPITLTIGDGQWSNGASTVTTTSNPSSVIATWIPPNVASSHLSTVNASVYDVSLLPSISITVNPYVPPSPTGVAHTNVTQTGWTESWEPVSGATAYELSLDGGPPVMVTGTTYAFSVETSATSYAVSIVPITSVGVRGPSATDSVTTMAPQPTPTPPPTNQNPSPPSGAISPPQQPPAQSPVILTDRMNTVAQVGQPFSYRILESGGVGPFVWSITSGQMPSGLTLDNSGEISGTVTGSSGRYRFTVQVKDANGLLASKAYDLKVIPAQKPPIFIPDRYAVFTGVRGPIQYGPHAFEIESYRLIQSQLNSLQSMSHGERIAGGIGVTQIVVQRSVDSASPHLFYFALKGTRFKGELVIQRKLKVAYDVLHDVTFSGLITSDHVSVDSTGQMQEQVTIDATDVKDTHRIVQVQRDGNSFNLLQSKNTDRNS